MAKKKTKRKRSPGSGAEVQRRRQERIEARRRERAETEQRRRRAHVRQKWTRRGIAAALGAALVWFLVARQATPEAIAGHELETFPEEGVGEHTDGNVDYASAPPVAGPHWASPAPCGTHAEPIRDEIYVHSLEHGAVAVFYRPDELPAEDIKRIESIVREHEENVLSAPYPDMETAMAVTSWGEMIRLDSFEADAVNEYIDTFAGDAPEPRSSCPRTVNESFDRR